MAFNKASFIVREAILIKGPFFRSMDIKSAMTYFAHLHAASTKYDEIFRIVGGVDWMRPAREIHNYSEKIKWSTSYS